jgi:hypothetical protein
MPSVYPQEVLIDRKEDLPGVIDDRREGVTQMPPDQSVGVRAQLYVPHRTNRPL